MRKFLRITALALLSLSMAALPLAAQRGNENDDRDPHVTLISAKSAQLIEKDGQNFRKVTGPARFFHNNTYLLCDTAWWNVNTNVITAIGHVKIMQDRTTLTSETLEYVVDEDMARFRGLVELEDKEHNILRTRYLDYNTKDSVAVFQNGGSMKDKDGQIVESLFGTYEAKMSLFVFNDEVNMFSDSIFVKTSRLEYRSDLNTAYFGYGTDAWESDRMMSANDGWYDRNRELFFFRRKVHLLTKDQESWSDSLFYYRQTNDLEMLGHVELIDTTRSVYALAGRLEYIDSLSRVRMTRDPAVVSWSENNGRVDTLYLGGNLLQYQSKPMCDVDSMAVVNAKSRLVDLAGDPITEYRRKAAEAAAKAAEEAAANDPNRPPGPGGRGAGAGPGPGKAPGTTAPGGAPAGAPAGRPPVEDESVPPVEDELPMLGPRPGGELPDSTALAVPADSLGVPTDSLAVPADSLGVPTDSLAVPADSLGVPTDSLAVPADSLAAEVPPAPKDSTKIGFITATGRVRMYRSDIQMVCDSLVFTELDSLIRLYKDPIIYNEGNRQYVADSVFVQVHNNRVEKASLMSNAFITTCEDSLVRAFDQIKGAEMLAYFDSTAALTRFDALGGASALFFLEENGKLATVNKVESKMLYATFEDGNLQRIYYFEDAKNDAYPAVQLPREERMLKGFRWDPDKQPKGPKDITTLEPRGSERTSYLDRPHPEYRQTNRYFPGYMPRIARRDSLAVVREREKANRPATSDVPDTPVVDDGSGSDGPGSDEPVADDVPEDEIIAGDDTTGPEENTPHDGSVMPTDSTNVDSGSSEPEKELTAKERREQKREQRRLERERRRAERQAAREARWAEQDRRYEERQAAKEQKRLERERARKLRALQREERRAQRERRLFEKYLKQFSQ